jgi:hypothetical protein
VYAWRGAGHFRRSVGSPLRPIVAESLRIQAKIEKKLVRLKVVFPRSPTVASPWKMLMRRLFLMKLAPSLGES